MDIDTQPSGGVLMVTGHPRSGTGLLWRLCDHHPDIRLTRESGCFRALGVPRTLYALGILGRMWARRHIVSVRTPGHGDGMQIWYSRWFFARFLQALYRHRTELVHMRDVEALLRTFFPQARYVGDKLPSYVFNLNAFVGLERTKVVVIYRDGRDVVASFLRRVRTAWKRKAVVGQFDTPEKIARRWCQAIEQMQRHRSQIHAVRYETLVQQPEAAFEHLGAFLGVDPAGFPRGIAQASSVGCYRQDLSRDEHAAVLRVAGPTLEALGYL